MELDIYKKTKMEKRILTEINRNREIMGLEVILEQEKTEKEKRYFIYNDRKIIAFISFLIMGLLYCFSYSALFYDPITSHFSIITIPFLIYAFIRSEDKDYIRLFTYAILVLNILLSWTLFPFLFVAQFFIFYLSKYYYWHRFNIHFPKFVIDEKD